MIRFFVDHATTVLLMVVCVVLFGTASYLTMPRESAPDIAIPFVLVTTPYIGVSPEDIEGLVTVPIENELAGLKGVKEMSSTSAEGVSIISMEFQPDVVIEDALQKVRDRVDKAKPKLPEDAEDPSVAEISLSDVPILIVSMAGGLDEEGLKELAEKLEDDLTRIPGVLDVNISGGQERQFRVQVDPYRLGHYGLPMYDVTGALADENVNIPGGQLAVGEGSFLLRVPAEYQDAHDLEGVAIKRRGDRPVFIRDVARVVDGFEDRTTYARMNQEPAVSVSVTKRSGANIIEICDEIKRITTEQAESWPEGVRYEFLGDQSKGIRNIVSDLQNNILTALILVVGVVLFFMGFRNSLFVGIAIPLSMLMSFLVIDLLGFTLNMVVLFSLILALGMLVDNAIVVIENIYRHLEMGKSRYQAAIDGTNEVAIAVAASTATTVAAFFPMVFWTGIIGKFMSYLPKTLIIVLVSSLVVAIVVLPVAASKLMSAKVREGAENEDEAPLPTGRVMSAYRWVLEASIRFRYPVVVLGVLALFGTFGLYAVGNNGTEFFPSTEPDRAVVAIRAPDGTDIDATDQVVRIVEDKLTHAANVDVFVAETGVSGGDAPPGQSQGAPNEAKITVDFQPDRNSAGPDDAPRVEPTSLTIEKLRAVSALLPGVQVTVEKEALGPPTGKPVELLVSGDDFHTTGDFAQKVRRMAAEIPGVTDITDDYRVGRPEMRLRIDRGAAKRVGVTAGTIGNEVRTALAGSKATVIREGEDEYDVLVEVAPEYKDDLQAILGLRVPGRLDTSPDTFPVPLSTVADYELAGGSGSIRHKDQRMVVTISGDVADGFNANDVQQQVFEAAQAMDAPPGVTVSLGSSNANQQESMSFLIWAMGLALALIVLVLVTQFDSLTIPLIIMATVVLSLIGVLNGLLLTRTPFGIIMTGIGVISLAGVVVNNAIVLLDYVGQLRERGMSVHDALIRAGMTRFRPVMLTAVTTVLGLIPMAAQVSFDFMKLKVLVGGQSAAFWTPMAVAVIFGLSFATVLTLVMVPTLYSILDDLERLWARVMARIDPARVAATAAKVLLGALVLGQATDAQALTLEQSLASAERTNLRLMLAHEQTVQTGTYRAQALAALLPKVAAQGKYTRNQKAIEFAFADSIDLGALSDFIPADAFGEPITIQPLDQWTGYVNVKQPIFAGEGLVGLQAAGQNYKATVWNEERTRAQIRAGAAQLYYALRTSREAQALAGEALGLAKGQLDLAQRQVGAGLADRRAVLQAQLSVAQATRDLEDARQQVAVMERRFANTVGIDPSEEVLEEPPEPLTPSDLQAAIDQANSDRPDLVATGYQVKAARLQRNALWLGWLPSVDFNFNYNYSSFRGFGNSGGTDGGIGEYDFLWQMTVTADWVLWDGGYRRAQIAEYSSQLRAAELNSQLVRQDIQQEVEESWLALLTATKALEATTAEVALAKENHELTERAVKAGSATWLELQQAELGLRSANLALLQRSMERDLAAIDLLVSTGNY